MQSTKRIAILMSCGTAHYRRVVEGVLGYASHLDWEFHYEPRSASWEGLSLNLARTLLRDWRPDGILTTADPFLAPLLRRSRAPVVHLTTDGSLSGFYSVICDNAALAGMAAQYFIDRQYANLAYLGRDTVYCHRQCEGFRKHLAGQGLKCESLSLPLPAPSNWRVQFRKLSDWLARLPKPLALLTDAPRANDVVRACRELGLSVPQDVAVMATGDEMECQLSPVPISCVEMPSRQMGAEAAKLLQQLLMGRRPVRKLRMIRPTRVIERRSTDATAIDDPQVRRAADFVLRNVGGPLSVGELVGALKVSRRMLECRFHDALGCTPFEFIERTHLDRAKRLLAQTDLQIKVVARSCGYTNPEVFAVAFRRRFGVTATEYRRRQGGRRR